jgi:hypothetical protein
LQKKIAKRTVNKTCSLIQKGSNPVLNVAFAGAVKARKTHQTLHTTAFQSIPINSHSIPNQNRQSACQGVQIKVPHL